VTEFRVAGKKLYLPPVMDHYDVEIVAYESSNRPDFPMLNKPGFIRTGAGTTACNLTERHLARYGMKRKYVEKRKLFR
jgi:hypothetical protein